MNRQNVPSHFRQLKWMVCLLITSTLWAQHPGVQPRPGPSSQTLSPDGKTTVVVTRNGQFDSQDPFANPPGSNFLQTVNSNMFDGNGVEMPNTLPSTPERPYNLHPDPVVSEIDKTSPTDDLSEIFKQLHGQLNGGGTLDLNAVQRAIDIIEGNPVPDRVYSGLPLLHYNGPEKVKRVEPIFDDQGNKIGGNVHIHQVWYDSHIESDTSLLDPSDVLDVPWTITYTVDTLNRGHEDFAPMVMYTDDPALSPAGMPPMPHVAMDQTFFPMEDGTRTIFEIAMTPGKYYNLTYHWGWRIHPPRVQVTENARKRIQGKTLVDWERDVFGPNPTASEANKLAAIAKIGNLAPAKRMWSAFRLMRSIAGREAILGERAGLFLGSASVFTKRLLDDAERAFFQWQDRTVLPDGVTMDPDSDVTLFFVNNTIYGNIQGRIEDGESRLPEWTKRPYEFKVKLINGDHFMHAYVNVDFGGSRGWENQFHSTVNLGGAGPWFTFGRFHWWLNAGAPPIGLITVPPAKSKVLGPGLSPYLGFLAELEGARGKKTHPGAWALGEHNVHITFNYEPSRRLRMYQFDPLHHDVAIWSIH